MRFLNRIRNIRGIFNLGVGGLQPESIARNYDFIEWKGDASNAGVVVDLDSLSGITDAYFKCSTLSTIINRNALALINGKWWIVDDKDNDISSSYKGISALLKRPNPLQSWSSFISQVDVYRQAYGEAFILAVTPVGFSKQEASALWAVNPNYIDIELTGKMYMQTDLDDIVVNYYLNVGGTSTLLEKSDVLHIKDTNQNILMSPSDIRGRSRLAGLNNTIRNIIQAEEAIYALNKDRGAQGILTNNTKDAAGHVQLDDEEQQRLQSEFNRYGLKANQSKVIISNADLNWKQMSFNVRDLMLFEGMDNNIQRISDALDYPYELLSHSGGVTYANKLEAKRFHYQDNIIPMSKMYAEHLTSFFGLSGASLIVDFGEVECLKKSETEKASMQYQINQAMRIAKDAGVVSTAEWRLAMGMDEEIYKPDTDKSNNSNNNDKTTASTGQEGEE